MGNKDVIRDGEVQWMTAGSGILHEEMPKPQNHMLGVQIWLNLPKEHKMTKPGYNALTKDEIVDIPVKGGLVRLFSGSFGDVSGFQGHYVPANFYSIQLEPQAEISFDISSQHSAYLFTLKGDAFVGGELVEEKTAVSTTEGDKINISALDEEIEILFFSAPRLNEEISWGGPIVMNTREELQLAFEELRQGTFIK